MKDNDNFYAIKEYVGKVGEEINRKYRNKEIHKYTKYTFKKT